VGSTLAARQVLLADPVPIALVARTHMHVEVALQESAHSALTEDQVECGLCIFSLFVCQLQKRSCIYTHPIPCQKKTLCVCLPQLSLLLCCVQGLYMLKSQRSM
jgi:hypothetical protein